MRWPTEATSWQIGPAGLAIAERPAGGGPLRPGDLAAALAAVPASAGVAREILVDDAWARTLLVELPAGGLRGEERRALIGHRLREVFDGALAAGDWREARAAGLPWPGWWKSSANCLVSVLLPEVAAALADRRALRQVLTLWGEALSRVPATAQGALAVFGADRISVGAWTRGRWLGWRSFVVGDLAAGQAELQRWLAELVWPAGERTIWYRGWTPAGAFAAPGRWQALPLAARRRRPPVFQLKPVSRHERWPLRRRLIALAAGLTLLATVYVSLPESSEPAAEGVVAALPPRPRPPVAEEASVAPAPEAVPEVQEESVVWPEILGIYTSGRQRQLLYRTAQGAATARRGELIDQRFRVERLAIAKLTLVDTVTQERREFELESSGVQP